MFTILIGMGAIILLGTLWQLLLGRNSAEKVRAHLAKAVYEIFLPALVLNVMWQTEVNLDSVRVPLVSAIAVLLSLLAASLVIGNGKHFGGRRAAGALLLAAGFGNFTYLGLPVLTQTFGPWAQPVAIQFDLFANTPLLFTLGIMLAGHFGHAGTRLSIGRELVRVPALWAAIAGVAASGTGLTMPAWLGESLDLLGAAVVPLMLLSIGMALRWQQGWLGRIPVLLPVIVIQLVVMPLIVWAGCIAVGMPAALVAPSVIEGAMPCMVLGIVICDRFRLDSGLYAEAVTITTALSLITLPLWLKVIA